MMRFDQQPVARFELSAEINGEPAEHVAQRVLQGQTKHNTDHAGTGQQTGHFLLVNELQDDRHRGKENENGDELADELRHGGIILPRARFEDVVPDEGNGDERPGENRRRIDVPFRIKLKLRQRGRHEERHGETKNLIRPPQRHAEPPLDQPSDNQQREVNRDGNADVQQREIGDLQTLGQGFFVKDRSSRLGQKRKNHVRRSEILTPGHAMSTPIFRGTGGSNALTSCTPKAALIRLTTSCSEFFV